MSQTMELVKAELPAYEALISLSRQQGVDVHSIALQELSYLQQLAQTNQFILQCEPGSIIAALKGMMRENLTLAPEAGLTYVTSRNANIGTNEKKVWVKILEIKPSP